MKNKNKSSEIHEDSKLEKNLLPQIIKIKVKYIVLPSISQIDFPELKYNIKPII